MGINTRPVGGAKKVHINTETPLQDEDGASESEENTNSNKNKQ